MNVAEMFHASILDKKLLMNNDANNRQQIANNSVAVPSPLRVLPCFTRPFFGVPFALSQPQEYTSPADLRLHSLMGLQAVFYFSCLDSFEFK
jgi:hypothetical protein